ncbi:MAG TPA: molybdopterin cofactor-binding domain-containing protein [Vicinamibacterales bacterium]|nr:molybdopterin cofactor-binding domain-containing protein [Vicinamibacterales bacterium]
MRTWTRRAFIGAGSVIGGGFVLGVAGVALAPNRLGVVPGAKADGAAADLNTWVTVTPDNVVTILVPHCEMGQGSQTALAMMAAEEMDADWTLVRVKEAPALDEYANEYVIRAFGAGSIPGPVVRGFDYGTYRIARWARLQVTGGSSAVRGTGVYGMTVAGAAAKEMLVGAAAQRFGVNPSELSVKRSRVIHDSTGRSAGFGELAAAAAKLPVPTRPVLKTPDSYTIRRTARRRFDIPSKVDGSAMYAIDFKVPGMLYAAVEIAPVFGGTLQSLDSAPAEAAPGVKRVLRLGDAIAVVADSYWHARSALAALKPVFDAAGHGDVSSGSIFAAFDKSLGAAPEMPAGAATVVKADYRVPFLAHATMETMCCTARVEGNRAEVWTGVQDPLNGRGIAAKALGLSPDNVRFTNLLLGGGFGRRLPGNLDYIDMSARIAKAMSPAPVKMVWSRENDIQHDYYRPAAMARFAAALDASGTPISLRSRYAGGGDGESTFMPYAIGDMSAKSGDAAHPIRTGPWRSVLNSQHGFFKESFIDEMAHAARKDPYGFRRDLLKDQPRFRAALDKVAAMADWTSALPEREGRGIALTACFGTIAAEVAHVAVSPEGRLRVRAVFAAVDCGDVVNVDSATAQAEGGIIFGLSAALLGEITIAEGRVVERNFRDYQMIRLADAPQITVEFIRSDEKPGGLGEPCVPPIAAAVANAIFAATGTRVRDLPIKNHDLSRRASSAT